MAEWKDKTLEELFPDGIDAIADGLAAIGSTVADALLVLAGALSDLSNFLVDATDPLAAILDALIADLNAIVQDLENTGLYQIVVLPQLSQIDLENLGGLAEATAGAVLEREFSYDQFITTMVQALNDTGDPNRPDLTEFATISGAVMLVGAPSLADLMALIKKLGDVFGIQEFIDLWNRFNFLPDDREARFGQGLIPDFDTIRAIDLLPPLAEIVVVLKQLIAILAFAAGILEFIQQFAEILQEKADKLAALAQEIQDILDLIATLLDDTGIFVLLIPPTVGGTQAIINELQNSGNPPPFGDGSFVAGVGWFGGAGAGPALEIIFG